MSKFSKLIVFPIRSFFSQRVGFTVFFRRNGRWMARTRGVSFPIHKPRTEALEYYRHFVPEKGGVVFDCGGELGLECEQLSGMVGPEGKVFTFECLPEHALHLKEMAAKLGNVKVIERALWNKPQTLDFFRGNTAGSSSAVSGARGQNGQNLVNAGSEKYSVEADTLDNLWRQLVDADTVDFLKMDIEGAEYEALEGAKMMLQCTKKIVVAAYHLRDGVKTAGRVADMLKGHGFKVRVDENDHVYGVRL